MNPSSRVSILLSLLLTFAFTGTVKAFEFKDNDRVVLLGGTLVEREQLYGFLETSILLSTSAKNLQFRNLAWSGDTVFGHARSYFGPPEEGLQRLTNHLEQLKPTVLVLCYGADLPFEGLKNLPAFITGYRKLLDLVRTQSPNARVVIVSPPPFENLGSPLPNLTEANTKLESVRDALKELAGVQNATFVDAFDLMGSGKQTPKPPLTDNGIHYTEAGYKVFAEKIAAALKLSKSDVTSVEARQLRDAVVKKDFLFFNRWRPANETYLFGFRKHEQGQNAKEMAEFDPMVADQEKKITALVAAAKASAAKKLP